MHDKTLYAQILGIAHPWHVINVNLDVTSNTVEICVEHRGSLTCPCCGKVGPGYDTRRRRWRHLDTCQFQTHVSTDVPRVDCPEHGPRQIEVPWVESGSRFTILFESVVIDWLKEASFSAVARRMSLSWGQVDSIMSRAVRRGLDRREVATVTWIGIDETSYQKRHEYVTVISDLDRSVVLDVMDSRTKESVNQFYSTQTPAKRASIKTIAMDMWAAYIGATLDWIPKAKRKIAFDRFHVSQCLGKAVDMVRRQEHRELKEAGKSTLTRTKFLWLQNPSTMNATRKARFETFRTSTLRTAKAWAIKEAAKMLWEYETRETVKRDWEDWLAWAW